MDTTINITTMLDLHSKWRRGEPGGRRTYLSGADLSGADLSRANLSGADLSGAGMINADLIGADLINADLKYANLRYANLSGANLSGANLRYANLSGADLSGADLSGADLSGTDLSGANLSGANLRGAKGAELALAQATFLPEGSIIGWKKCKYDVLVKLLIPSEAKRSHGATRKCRASEAIVLEVIGAEEGRSIRDGSFVYRVGDTVRPNNGWCEDRWEECAPGIHFFITREEAEAYPY